MYDEKVETILAPSKIGCIHDSQKIQFNDEKCTPTASHHNSTSPLLLLNFRYSLLKMTMIATYSSQITMEKNCNRLWFVGKRYIVHGVVNDQLKSNSASWQWALHHNQLQLAIQVKVYITLWQSNLVNLAKYGDFFIFFL
jgi:hypothetical protein